MGKKGKAAKATQKDQAKAEKKKKQEQKMKDASFGLKNKGKSKVVQQKIAHMQNSMNAPGSQRAALQQKQKKAQKEAEEKARLEMEAMFKTVKKKENDNQAHLREEKMEEKKVVKVDPKVRIQQLLDGTLPEMLDRTLEDRIEEARTLVEKKTKMTEDVFKSWLERKTKKEMDAAKKAKAERWKKNRYTGKEIWFKFKVQTKDEDEADAFDEYEKPETPPESESEDEEEAPSAAAEVQATA
ncbi:hypothetical protein HKI87_11g65010 [Chloropicon roscoffensis]|uniref:ZC3H15/TMA46 family C-terminal domain-containing protein n=1 Tax=Chloropicon roscoffensis TaxID=1461544 RepID=A0AAX4PG95_9CHLO|mmetsp:Transcript_3528/g.10694  ORF Transcript_3528/g.10694 Transcript_3528/m.10694 type:complete len:241 (-) Transcript_3528:111-833(-)|eukprot:CAMPEP_0198466736 /NCGR_PEP_ID=MMETSP1456-20131121/4205_1 /TAXON_ID=1461544 ORGANISM="Unidentified sp., Strain RCC1871" /NCGR_SAMPLE_ID=MMETSP1456 /ASSEMBLY_ACC=CAM_ASM_001119 /LENGTH=240 /DNA_ID=CAMNT_0044192691 /DNA_START=308 /DNA_END=1030 /DNA_ORIENTATION=+